jgi:hypothetical protein
MIFDPAVIGGVTPLPSTILAESELELRIGPEAPAAVPTEENVSTVQKYRGLEIQTLTLASNAA